MLSARENVLAWFFSLRNTRTSIFSLACALFFLCWRTFAVLAQTQNVSSAQPVISSSGQCLMAYSNAPNAALYWRSCDGSAGQTWDISTYGPHIFDSGYAIIILSGVCF